MFFKTVYHIHNNENIPYKVEAVYDEKTYITLLKKDEKWLVSFLDKDLSLQIFDSYIDGKFFFDTAVIRAENLINARIAKDKAIEDLQNKTMAVSEAELKFHEWMRDQ